jgi:hypothetical protein
LRQARRIAWRAALLPAISWLPLYHRRATNALTGRAAACMPLDDGNATLYVRVHLRGPQMSDVFDEAISRQSPPNDPARIAAEISADARFAYFASAAFAIRLLRLDQKIGSGVPMSLKRVANVLGTDATLFQEFIDRFSRYGNKTVTLFADGIAVAVPLFF